ncbi:hypothetical protein RU58_00007 [Achromobacter phage phiAxp-1]|uniref:hypothetical protein n=1 Tax=Achromobacter phage phiAxp-1 TaxID=1610509 RepID=UPI00065670A7|nr:hypothetical protein RU58_00007 [Achromobacter phage phiAxp-1]AKJ71396.1 hypothetical protein RU58_00007 [Achromobacter phage phiAxp-1]QDH84402.1 hypothetical protein Axy18_007 [Achromobacter phage vB_AxyS_19-32_Axy18]QDH84531.1 hypothetical protein Axy20_007 [Achromobacter phage vB_AxyS_19-32_Axy20]WNO48617.1 hypothetical protein [Achromobacter phage shaaii_LB5]
MFTEDYVSPMLQDTRNMIRNRPPEWTYDRLAKETGLGYPWIASFMTRMPNPSINRVEYLYHFMRKVHGYHN